MTKDETQELKGLIAKLNEAHSALNAFWRRVDLSTIESSDAEEELAASLKQLIISRIDILNSFELLTRIRPEDSLAVLKARYLGAVSPDEKFGAYKFELVSMLEDLVDICGKDYLRILLKDEAFDQKKLKDPRVVESFMEALSFSSREEFLEWSRHD